MNCQQPTATADFRLIITSDGSHTLYVPSLNEHYHSVRGAVQESRHVYIGSGFRYICKNMLHDSLKILEVGFGTGLNALLTLLEAEHAGVEVYYEALEKYPLPMEVVAELNYATASGLPDKRLFMRLHSTAWDQQVCLSPYFTLHKRLADLLAYEPEMLFDLIYFDAFAPDVQPDLWTEAVFRKLYECLCPGGTLVTYSSKGAVKIALRQAGFNLWRLSGAGGKRHMLRAVKSGITVPAGNS
ncbi:MAG: tRNA (5-methylaminomethyl-2-thiouridine)(34)-methyltransferase MnmD [Prevotellaceae bacterium]|jgi:tRNA U34 5-methylaminomethyl-2-thiouridine-forming methyltransferase MnmC|nr:tRNA (5-methylaminomethyl-2-thiouridine)(34)-methyltransferase MnmD [Prevotellaceae bacterium]